jgi:hypothetical protein
MANDPRLAVELQALRQQVTALDSELQALKVSLLPRCHKCGAPANKRARIYLGRIRMAQDVWACAACCEIEASDAA